MEAATIDNRCPATALSCRPQEEGRQKKGMIFVPVKEYARAEEVSAGFGVDLVSASDLSRGIGVSETAKY